METALALQAQRFDAVYSLDKDPGLTALAVLVQAPRKYGFGLNEHGNVFALNPAAAYALRLGVDDELKFRVNDKTYQQMIFEAAGPRIPRRRLRFRPGQGPSAESRRSSSRKIRSPRAASTSA